MSGKRFGVIIGALAVAGTLAACSGGTPGAAAVVDGRAISESDVDSVVQQLQPVMQNELVRGSVALTLAQEPTLREVASEYGLAMTDSEVRTSYATAAEQLQIDPVELTDASVAFVRYQTIATTLNSMGNQQATTIAADFTERQATLDIDLNPRYGEEIAVGTFAPTTYPWIVQTTADVTAG